MGIHLDPFSNNLSYAAENISEVTTVVEMDIGKFICHISLPPLMPEILPLVVYPLADFWLSSQLAGSGNEGRASPNSSA